MTQPKSKEPENEFEIEDLLYDFRQAIEAALYPAVQDSTERYDAAVAIANTMEKVIDAKLRKHRP